jgi:stage II sporulation protein Q
MKPEESNTNSSNENRFNWKKLYAKKWFFPAVYVSVTALILSVAWWYEGQQLKQVSNTHYEDIGVNEPTDAEVSQIELPVSKDSEAEIAVGFYDDAKSTKEKQSCLVKYGNTYWPNTGCDFVRKDGNTFNVVAVMDGKVVQMGENPIVGKQVEIQHKDGSISVYQSLADVTVKKGQAVKKGNVIAKAGRNAFNKELGNHLHFEIRKNNTAENPEQYFTQN